MFTGAESIRHYPEFLKPLVLWLKTDVYAAEREAKRYLIPVLKERIEKEDRYIAEGRRAEWQRIKDQDVIQWVLDVTPPNERSPSKLLHRMLHINLVAVHTSSISFLDMFLCLCFTPQYQQELRDEIVRVFKKEGGWSKQTLTYLVKLDSFMTEVARVCVLSACKFINYPLPYFIAVDRLPSPALSWYSSSTST